MKSLANSADKEEIASRVKSVRPDSPRRWGKMTASQMICHLADSFRVTIGERPAASQVKSPVPVRVMKWMALYSGMPWPKSLPTRPEVDAQIGGTPPGIFEADVQELLRLLDRFSSPVRDFRWQPHPMFGLMPERDWMRWGYLHMNHHLRQFGA
jgi:hypothetical protein